MGKIRAVIFDLDGTLIDSAVAAAAVLNRMLAARGLQATDKMAAAKWVSLGAKALVTHAIGDAAGDIDEAVAEFRRIYRAMAPDPGELFPHALEMLAALRAQGYRLGICTNKPEELAVHVAGGIGLMAHVEVLVGGRAGLAPKPDAAPVLEVLRLLGVGADEAVYVGDSEIDAEAAKAAGVPFLLVTFGYAIGRVEEIACAGRVGDFRELVGVLGRWEFV